MYQFRIAVPEDKPSIVSFMNAHWGKEHPLVNQPDFFEFYYHTRPQRLNFALCEDEAGKLCAIAGFIPASQAEKPDIWVSLWVADKTARGSGLELMAQLPDLTGCGVLACNNIRPETRPFYEFLGYTTGRMEHFYRLADRPSYRLARVVDPSIPPAGGDMHLRPLIKAEALEASGFTPPPASPQKDLWYLRRRYYEYPRQHYRVFGGFAPDAEAPLCLLIARLIESNGAAVLRIVDYIGGEALLPRLGAAVDRLMQRHEVDFCDFYCAGFAPEILEKTGFMRRAENDPNIIPNYLQPPLFENTDFYYFTSDPAGFRMCKADGDQDRPSLIY